MGIHCPQCDSANVQALKLILDAGTTHHSGSWSGYVAGADANGGAGGFLSGSVETTSKTGLAKEVENFIYKGCPENSNNLHGLIWTGILLALAWGAISMFMEFLHPKQKCDYTGRCITEDFPLFALMLGELPFFLIAIYLLQKLKKWVSVRNNYNKEYPKWLEAANYKYLNYFLCKKCGAFFDKNDADDFNSSEN